MKDSPFSHPLPLGPMALHGFKVAEISTCHITKKDRDILATNTDTVPSEHPQVIMAYEHGYFVSTWHDGKENPENFEATLLKIGHSEAYVNLVRLSHCAGAKWLNLDCDSFDYDWLPEYSW